MAEISVIVPMYGVEQYIEGCLKSIQNQTFQDFECLCINDGSPDKSGEIAEQFAAQDSRFKVLHQENGGLSAARNAGVKNTSAPYVFFIDSDDYIHPQTLEFLLKALRKSNTKLVNCQLQNVTETYKPIEPNLKFDDLKLEQINNPLEHFCKKSLIRTGVMLRLYERELVEQVPFIEGIYFEDIPFSSVCLDKIDTLAFLHAPLYYYYRQSNSIMRSAFSSKKVDSYDILIRHLHSYFIEKAPEKMPLVREHLFNKRIKMLLNQCIRKQPDKTAQYQLIGYAQQKIKALYDEGIISFEGLKLKHKIALYLLLKNKPEAATRFLRFVV